MAKDHIVAAPKPIEIEILIARGYGPTAYPSDGPPTNALTAFIRKQYPGEWLVRIPALGHAGATARVTFKGKPGWRCDCPNWVNTHSCKHVEAAFVMHGGRPFALPMPVCEWVQMDWSEPASTALLNGKASPSPSSTETATEVCDGE